MKFLRFISLTAIVTIIMFSLSGCGSKPSPSTSEAYEVGFDLGIADRCGRTDRRSMQMPSAYDDSMGSGKLENAFSNGYNQAMSEANPCKCL